VLAVVKGTTETVGDACVAGGRVGVVATGCWGETGDEFIHPDARMRTVRTKRIQIPENFMKAYSAGEWLYVVKVPTPARICCFTVAV
jgi:hypothetical protein